MDRTLERVAEVVTIGFSYIVVSAGLITFNKYLMRDGRFPHALHLTALHMSTAWLLSMALFLAKPSLYPSMAKARENFGQLAKFLLPLGMLFSLALFASNKAYIYSSVAFLQFCKQGNVALIFFASCALGLQHFTFRKMGILLVVVLGCSLCATGEIRFRMPGLLLQLMSQVAECTKNIIGEVVLNGAGLKLDVLTFVAFQAPFSLLPLLSCALVFWTPAVAHDLFAMWPVLLLNAVCAFALNVLIALTLKRLSALSFVLLGLAKDVTIVCSSAMVFGDPISHQQFVGFAITLVGMGLWSHLKLEEQNENADETAHIVEKAKKEEA